MPAADREPRSPGWGFFLTDLSAKARRRGKGKGGGGPAGTPPSEKRICDSSYRHEKNINNIYTTDVTVIRSAC